MSSRLIKLIGWWQIACAALGLGAYLLFASGIISGGRAWIQHVLGYPLWLTGVLFFVVAIASGRAFIRGRSWGLPSTLAIQFAHSFWFALLGGPHYQVASGPKIGLTASSYRIGFTFGFESAFFFGTRVSGPSWEFGVNILAVVWTVLLFRAWIARDDDRRVVPSAG